MIRTILVAMALSLSTLAAHALTPRPIEDYPEYRAFTRYQEACLTEIAKNPEKIVKACWRRDQFYETLVRYGFCWGPDDVAETQKHWSRCSSQ